MNNSPYTQIVSAQSNSGPFTLVNPAVNTATVNITSNVSGNPQQNDDVPLPPGASISFDGTKDTYAYCPVANSSAVLYKLPSGTDYNPGTLAINGNVNATVTGNVAVTNTPNVNVANTASVNVANTPAVSISGTPAVTISGTPTVDIGTVSGSIDIASVAGNVDVVGNGGYINPGLYASALYDTTTHTIAVSATYTTPVLNVQNYQSFSLSVEAYCPSQSNAGAPLVQQVQLQWYADAAATQLLETDTYWMWIGSSAATAANTPLVGGGPARGAYLTITFFNHSSIEPVDVILISVFGTGRATEKLRFTQPAPISGIASGITVLPSQNITQFNNTISGADGIIANESNNFNMAASNTYWLPFPLFEGQVSIRFATSTALANDLVVCTAEGLENSQVIAGSGCQGCIWNPGNVAGTDYTAVLNVGRAPLFAVMKATATAPTITLIAQGPCS
jgi:hypothetical protein